MTIEIEEKKRIARNKKDKEGSREGASKGMKSEGQHRDTHKRMGSLQYRRALLVRPMKEGDREGRNGREERERPIGGSPQKKTNTGCDQDENRTERRKKKRNII